MFSWLSCVNSICPTRLKVTGVEGFIIWFYLSFGPTPSLKPFVLNFNFPIRLLHMGITAAGAVWLTVGIMKT